MRRSMLALAALITLAPASRSARLLADTPSATTAGTQFTAPQFWTLLKGPWGATLAPPENTNHIILVDLPHAASAQAAVTAAWQLIHPGFNRHLNVATPQPARNGWDEAWEYDYETSPNERLVLFAAPQRAGKHWTVALVETAAPIFEKRLAAIQLILQSIRPQGYHPETFANRPPHTLNPARIAALQTFVQTSMQELGIPGAAIALVDHGKIIYEGGLGVRELGKPDPVDAHTLFPIASNTKGLTTLLLAELVDQHKLRWDEPVTQAYPAFKLGDAETTRHVQIKHLVCACTGLPRQDLDWLLNSTATTSPAQIFATLSTMQPTTPFGQTFQYSNLMASAAGYIAGHAVFPNRDLGTAYDTAMQTMIFAPLGMADTTFDFPHALQANHASPHDTDINGHPALGRMDANTTIISARPAGGAWSSAHDMALYINNELTQGKLPNGHQLVSAANLLARRIPKVEMGQGQSYGMGLMIDTSYGITVIHHGGSLFGYRSDAIALPDTQIGAVILTNADTGGRLLRPFLRRVLELVYDGKPEAAAGIKALAASARAERAALRKNLTIPPDPALAHQLAAHYTNPALGHIDVHQSPGSVTFDFGAWHSAVASRRNADGTASFVTIDPTTIGVEFLATRDGLIIRDGQHEYGYIGK